MHRVAIIIKFEMGFFPFFGIWLRFVFVYQFNSSKMNIAIRQDEDSEDYKNVIAGALGSAVLLLATIVVYEIIN